ncbi:MAG: hypothetical protein UV82_C0009G0045 [Candidatus Magasanikbacteria bacterium GW2011_GWD2_43_18]|uniref:Uncharacterized protein n=1 Tax=Candidatus Magasanikbacteria bacterium GW2011_GWE2_42_7 TaxID=1619052 RepID=A0A0G1EBI1_9BACT|nr:MAG: hypothetical protein UV18_C0004G0129 [Candidatus Magasanikbacteria bacterium GW2011_GWC2_42_27]KKS71958.1 MAG: hypothetical protein UV42_C0016G0007 [Candidatus Magasanikbacteria bacterium GW2011_GWE2_42_7]KKT04306.1 MAG: hypothetical protein UV82_C0009G0045 [Candidatus Magasanikbacteria bacterium GW2011_GWD2_43_18]KKT24881.1 MAG: hypothetical protein UW10_C0018G0033 [Candidatus Magasanikbacteria bacterium GW2011_GWA2_43_9]HBB38350.1 hypothetical protein [Candidatus Magasanikbacteria bac
MDNAQQSQPPQSAGQPDYANMSEKEQMDAAMKQAGMGPGDLKKMVAKNMAKNMVQSTAKSWMRRLLSRFLKF